jgi:hypothetical protein
METANGAESPTYRAISWIFTVEVRSLSQQIIRGGCGEKNASRLDLSLSI